MGRAAVAGALPLLLAMGCAAGSDGVEQAASASLDSSPSTVTKTMVATASVLITEPLDEGVEAIIDVTITPAAVVVDAGDSVTLSAIAYSADGAPLTDVEFAWTMVDPRAGRFQGDGLFQAGFDPAVYDDAISVTAFRNTEEGIQFTTADASVTVVGEAKDLRLSSVEVYPDQPTVLQGQIYRLRAVGFDQDGVVIPDVSFAWYLADESLGELNSIGYLAVDLGVDPGVRNEALSVTGVWDGRAITAAADVRVLTTPRTTDFLNVQVLPRRFHLDPGDHMKLQAVALNGLGELVTGTELRWSVLDDKAGTIDGNGIFTASVESGVYTESVQVEAVVPGEQGIIRAVDLASVVIRETDQIRKLHSVRVLPDKLVIGPGGRTILVPQAVDESGQLATGVSFNWEAASEAVGDVSGVGSFHATNAPGVYRDALTVTAIQDLDGEVTEISKTVDVVITGELAEVSVTPSIAAVSSGRTVHLSVTVKDQNGVELPGLIARWSVIDEEVGTIDAFGNFTAGDHPGLYEDVIRAEIRQTIPVD